MNPNLFLKTFWRNDIQPQVFVAMSFDDVYRRRYDDIIAPAIESISLGNVQLKAYRVDTSRTGDSVLTDIMEGIAHSELFLADVSTLGHDSKTGKPYRNGNVMYEVGLALACRQSCEILLIRDDRDPFLFDVSTIPHKYIEFTDPDVARDSLHSELVSRMRERDYIHDSRVELAVSTMSIDEKEVLNAFRDKPPDGGFGIPKGTTVGLAARNGISRLLDKQVLKIWGIASDGEPVYQWTTLGYAVLQRAMKGLRQGVWQPLKTEPATPTS